MTGWHGFPQAELAATGFFLTIQPLLDHWAWWIAAFMLGASIGSFLNVVIHRVPHGMSVNDPKRSFCPQCKNTIPMWLNLPLVSWLQLRGKCRSCGAPIAFRYFAVELLTALLFTLLWVVFAPQAPQVVVFMWLLAALLVAITFIDAEHLIIPTAMTWGGSVAGLLACALWPRLPMLAGGDPGGWIDGLKHGAIGWLAGFGGLWVVVQLGKMAFGKKALKFDQPEPWHLREPRDDHDALHFVTGGEEVAWWDMFSRKTDRLIVECQDIRMDGQSVGAGKLIIRETEIELPDGTVRHIGELKSLDGTATSAVIPREAMGVGDIHLLGMIGAFFGWAGVFFALFAASIYAIVAALIGRIGFGRQLPFGPFLALGCLTWAIGGWQLWKWYFDFLSPLWGP